MSLQVINDDINRVIVAVISYVVALETLGIKEFDMNPLGKDMDKISMGKFVKEA